jgi:CHAT domain-containing protein
MRKTKILVLLILLFLIGEAWGQSLEDYYKQGVQRYNVSDFRGALEVWEKGLEQAKKLNNKQFIGPSLNNIASVYNVLGDYPKAISYLEQSLKRMGETGDKKGEGMSLNNIGISYSLLGDYSKGISYFEQSLKMAREIENKKLEGEALNNIAKIFMIIGDYSKGLYYCYQVLKTTGEIGDKIVYGSALITIGNIYHILGDYPKSLSYYEQSLKIKREVGDKKGEGASFIGIGLVYQNIGDYSKALSNFEQSLKIQKEIGVPTQKIEANIGDVYLDQGKLEESYNVFKKFNDSIRLGKYYLKTGDYRKAEEEFSKYRKWIEAKEMPDAVSLFADYIGLGLSYEGLKEYSKAKEYYQKGMELIEKQRGSLTSSERERFLEAKVMGFSRLEPYEGMVRILIKEGGRDAQREALYYAERAKSKTFLEMLGVRELKGRTREDQTILEKEKEYQQALLILRKRMEVLERLESKAPEGELQRLKKEFEQKESEYERFIKEVKLRNSEIASLISVTPVSVERIQSLLDRDTTLLEYSSTKDTLYVWLVTKDDIKVYEIGLGEKDLGKKVDEFLLPNISNTSRKAEPIITLSVGEEYRRESQESERETNRQKFVQVASEFYKSIFAPVEKDIRTSKLIIVPHGVLHKVPFATLTDGDKYLVDKYSLSVLPAASVMEYVVKKRKPEKEKILVFANPQTDYVPLGFAEVEGKILSTLFPKNEIYYREKATETLAKSKASGFNVIHFATHGEFNDRQPLQSGLLLAKDEENDGYLQVHEIFGMDLANANLVTLSACETALSKIQGGDDLVGLSRGFIYAGTPSLLATLWKVDDRSTSILMEHFYRNWQKGMSKPEALRQAQITLKNMPQYKHPFYWAPFVMIGDWR